MLFIRTLCNEQRAMLWFSIKYKRGPQDECLLCLQSYMYLAREGQEKVLRLMIICPQKLKSAHKAATILESRCLNCCHCFPADAVGCQDRIKHFQDVGEL